MASCEGLKFCFLNCSCLSHRNATINHAKVLDVLAFFRDQGCAVMGVAETGVMASTHVPSQPDVSFDFVHTDCSLPGCGVGIIFGIQFHGRWARLNTGYDSCNFGAWIAKIGDQPFLFGVVYAPHSGHGREARCGMFHAVHQSWNRLRKIHHYAIHFLVGDMNLPTFLNEPRPLMRWW